MASPLSLIQDVAQVMHQVGQERWEELEQHLAVGSAGALDHRLDGEPLGGERASELIGEALGEVERDRNITRTRQNLHLHIQKAQGVIHDTLRDVQTLSDIGDIEYEGGHADTEHCLNEALRQLRLAQAIKPSDKDGN
jgi:hypothetical protein